MQKHKGSLMAERIYSLYKGCEVGNYYSWSYPKKQTYGKYICNCMKNKQQFASPSDWIDMREMPSFYDIAKKLKIKEHQAMGAYVSGMRKLRKALKDY